MNRAGIHYRTGHCDETTEDAQAALEFSQVEQNAPHLAVQARVLLLYCFAELDQPDMALDHLIDTVEVAERYGYEGAVPWDWNATVESLLVWSREGDLRGLHYAIKS